MKNQDGPTLEVRQGIAPDDGFAIVSIEPETKTETVIIKGLEKIEALAIVRDLTAARRRHERS